MKQNRKPYSGTLYVVGIPQGELIETAKSIQRRLDKQYGLFGGVYPPLHLTLNVFYSRNQESLHKAASTLRMLLQGQPPFKITVNGASCFNPPYKSLHLQAQKNSMLESISRRIHRGLALRGVPSQNMKNWDFHITLVDPLFAQREWTLQEFKQVCRILKNEKLRLHGWVKKLELWMPTSPPFHHIASFPLENF